jgi:hypothetical protein
VTRFGLGRNSDFGKVELPRLTPLRNTGSLDSVQFSSVLLEPGYGGSPS